MKVYRCKSCHAPLNYYNGAEVLVCDYCNTVNVLNEEEIKEKEKSYLHCKERIKYAKSYIDYKNVGIVLSELGNYKDCVELKKECLAKAKVLQEKEIKQRLIKVLIPILIIATLIFGIPISCSVSTCISRAKHDVSDITVSVAGIRTSYSNGGYYVYLDYKIYNGSGADVDSLKVITYISDKNGKSLGTITSQFGNSGYLNLQSGGTQIHETYLRENNPQNDTLFYKLYLGEYQDFKITCKVVQAEFSDGKYYYGN